MKGRPVEELIYEYMFPKPRQSDPQNFHALLQRYLILEVRQETHSFYGHLDTPEAKYPGLDYTHPIHRIRLSRWPWHRRLFRAFDALRLTPAEINNLTKWEGTKWAKERFERDQGIRIRDTTADGFPNYADPNDPYSAQALERQAMQRAASQETEEPADENEEDDEEEEEDEEEQDSDNDIQSSRAILENRLRQRITTTQQQQQQQQQQQPQPMFMMPLDEEWENWLKYAIESGELPHVADQIARLPGAPAAHGPMLTADDIFPARMMAAARAGRWDEIPEFLRDLMRRALGSTSNPAAAPAPAPPRAQLRYSDWMRGMSRQGSAQ